MSEATSVDLLLSGIHDAKNQLFQAEGFLIDQEAKRGIDLSEARYAIESAATRLNDTISAYQAFHTSKRVAMLPVVVDDFCAELAFTQKSHIERHGRLLNFQSNTHQAWLFDRELVMDMLNNAIQNAGRHARTCVDFSAEIRGDYLVFRVVDDGDGFQELPPKRGLGLLLARRLVSLHVRQGRQGELKLFNAASGGATVELWLP